MKSRTRALFLQLDIRELKIMSMPWIATLLLLLIAAAGSVRLDYSSVEAFGNSCPQLESCSHQRNSGSRELVSIKERNCACDDLCAEYGDCCIDAPKASAKDKVSGYSCHDLMQFGGVFMRDRCPPGYDGPAEVQRMCEAASTDDVSDPLGVMPATDAFSGVTYKNYYCSICHRDTEDIVLWTPRLECPTVRLFNSSEGIDQEYVYQHLDSVGGSWGIHLSHDNDSVFFHDCDVEPVMPESLVGRIRLCKPDLVSDCPPSWEDEDVRRLCASYMGARFVHGGDRFRNAHCALCNGVNMTHLSCQTAEMRGMVFFRQFESHSFSLLLDINEARGEDVGYVQVCDRGEIFDPFFKKCRSLACLPGHVKRGKNCVPQNVTHVSSGDSDGGDPVFVPIGKDSNGTAHNGSVVNTLVKYHPLPDSDRNLTGGASYNISDPSTLDEHRDLMKFKNCLLISLQKEDFLLLANNSIYVPKYDRIYEPTSYRTKDGSVLVCSHLETEKPQEKFLPTMGYVTIIGLGTSMVCLLFHFAAYCLVPDLRNLSGKNLMSQCISLFFAYACFIIGLFDMSFIACSTIAFLIYYFFQVSFLWMAILAYDVWRTLRMATTELRVNSGHQLKRFISYSAITWISPLLLITVMALAEYTDLFPTIYRPGFAAPRCWFKRRRALMVFFAAPLIAIMVANILLFVMSSRMILSTTQKSFKQQNQSNRRNFKLYLRLALLMGLTWIVGLVAGYVDSEVLWYAFVVLNTFQGLFIFVGFTCSTKVASYLRGKLRRRASGPREFKSASQTASTGSAFNTSTTSVRSSFAKKLSSKFLLKRKDSNMTLSTASQVNSPI